MKTVDKVSYSIFVVGIIGIAGLFLALKNTPYSAVHRDISISLHHAPPETAHKHNMGPDNPSLETLEIEIPESVTIRTLSVTKKEGLEGSIVSKGDGKFTVSADKGYVFHSDGHFFVGGTAEETVTTGGKLSVEIRVRAGDSVDEIRYGIRSLLRQSDSITYFPHTTTVHGVLPPPGVGDLGSGVDGTIQEVNGIVSFYFSHNKDNDLMEGLLPLRYISYLPNLLRLTIDNTSVSDSDLAHVRSLHALRVLSLSKLPITDSGIAHLKCLKNLHTLDVGCTGITSLGLESLRRSLPDTRIEADSLAF